MATMAISEARAQLASAIETALSEAVVLERHGRPQAVLISVERYRELLAAYEDQVDLAEAAAALAEPGRALPWEDVRADLGW